MIKYLVLFSMFLTAIGTAQENKFDTLLSLFDGTKKQIPGQLAFLYFDFSPSESAIGLLADKILIQNDSFIVVSTYNQCDPEKKCERATATSFALSGEKIDEVTYEQIVSDCSFNDSRAIAFISDSILVFKESRKKLDCLGNGELVNKREWLEFQPIKNGMFLKSYADQTAIEREHYIFSHLIFTGDELRKYTEEELRIIKNELFALHGYKFTTPKWQDYFKSKSWYKPLSNDVLDELTEIEKKNVELIVSMTEVKQ